MMMFMIYEFGDWVRVTLGEHPNMIGLVIEKYKKMADPWYTLYFADGQLLTLKAQHFEPVCWKCYNCVRGEYVDEQRLWCTLKEPNCKYDYVLQVREIFND